MKYCHALHVVWNHKEVPPLQYSSVNCLLSEFENVCYEAKNLNFPFVDEIDPP